jgi:hypothetical protein
VLHEHAASFSAYFCISYVTYVTKTFARGAISNVFGRVTIQPAAERHQRKRWGARRSIIISTRQTSNLDNSGNFKKGATEACGFLENTKISHSMKFSLPKECILQKKEVI